MLCRGGAVTQSGIWVVSIDGGTAPAPTGIQMVQGAGTAGATDGGVVSVQGVAGGVAQPISGTVTATQATAANLNATVTGTVAVSNSFALNATLTDSTQKTQIVGSTGTVAGVQSNNSAVPGNGLVVQSCVARSAAPSYLNGDSVMPSCDLFGDVFVQVGQSGGAATVIPNNGAAFSNGLPVLGAVAQSTLPTYVATDAVAPVVDTKGRLFTTGMGFNGASSPPAICDKQVAVSTLGTTAIVQQIAAVGSQKIYICGWQIGASTATAGTALSWVEGTGSNCGTGTAAVGGTILTTPTTAPTVPNALFGPFNPGFAFTATAGDALCLKQASATNSTALFGTVYYTQF
jgi:hypothetical protein